VRNDEFPVERSVLAKTVRNNESNFPVERSVLEKDFDVLPHVMSVPELGEDMTGGIGLAVLYQK
jgi:hypothetical protein